MPQDNPQPIEQQAQGKPAYDSVPYEPVKQAGVQQDSERYRLQPSRQLQDEITAYRIPPLVWGVAAIVTAWAGVGLLTASGILPAIMGTALVVAAVGCLVGAFKSRTKEYAQFSEMGVRRATETTQEQSLGQGIAKEKAIEVKGPEVKVIEEKPPEGKEVRWQQKEADRRTMATAQDGANR